MLNIVAGWNEPEIAMSRAPQKRHDDRYIVADEWITIMKRLRSEEGSFHFKGKHFNVPNADSEPKPLQSPYPLIMNATSALPVAVLPPNMRALILLSPPHLKPNKHR